MSEFVRVERRGLQATIWIDRQPKMNTMTVAMRGEFPAIFRDLDADSGVRVIVVRGAGGKAFSAGGDVAEFLTLSPADLEQWALDVNRRLGDFFSELAEVAEETPAREPLANLAERVKSHEKRIVQAFAGAQEL